MRQKMKLLFLGVGSAFVVGENNFQSNMLLIDEISHRCFLIDCGTDARRALFHANYDADDIDGVYISHLHADHAGGLEWLAFVRKFYSQLGKPQLYASFKMAVDLWEHSLAGGLSSLAGHMAKLEDYFDVHFIKENKNFCWQQITFELVQTVHVMNGDELMPSHGLFFEVNKKKIFITTDTQFLPDLFLKHYQQADIIFHDCELCEKPSGVHAHYRMLCGLDQEIKAKTWLYHYQATKNLPDAKAAGFAGFVVTGQSFQF